MTEPRKCPEPGCGLQMYVKRSHWDAKTQTYDLVEWECPRERFQCDPHELAALRAEVEALRKRNEELEIHKEKLRDVAMHAIREGKADAYWFDVFWTDEDFNDFCTAREADEWRFNEWQKCKAELKEAKADLAAAESRAQEAETKLRAAEDAVVVLTEALQVIASMGPDNRVGYPQFDDFIYTCGGNTQEEFEAYGSAYGLWCEQRVADVARAALSNTSTLAAQRKREIVREALEEARSIFLWLLGENGEFPSRPEKVEGKPHPLYWWRKELRERCTAILGTTEP